MLNYQRVLHSSRFNKFSIFVGVAVYIECISTLVSPSTPKGHVWSCLIHETLQWPWITCKTHVLYWACLPSPKIKINWKLVQYRDYSSTLSKGRSSQEAPQVECLRAPFINLDGRNPHIRNGWCSSHLWWPGNGYIMAYPHQLLLLSNIS